MYTENYSILQFLVILSDNIYISSYRILRNFLSIEWFALASGPEMLLDAYYVLGVIVSLS